jgi:hypothetical protein
MLFDQAIDAMDNVAPIIKGSLSGLADLVTGKVSRAVSTNSLISAKTEIMQGDKEMGPGNNVSGCAQSEQQPAEQPIKSQIELMGLETWRPRRLITMREKNRPIRTLYIVQTSSANR